jgi:phospholipase A1
MIAGPPAKRVQHMLRLSFLLCASALIWLCCAASAADEHTLADCIGIDDDSRRLACYDALAGRKPPEPAVQAPAEDQEPEAAFAGAVAPDVTTKELSLLSRHWELDREAKQGTFLLRLHKQNYFLPVHYRSSPNQEPETPTRGTAPDQQLQDIHEGTRGNSLGDHCSSRLWWNRA